MARWLTVLMALVAQGMALMSPVCLVRCVGADGHECLELVGQDCHCCDCELQQAPRVCAVAMCGDFDEDQTHDEHDAPVGWQACCEQCPCQHLPLGSAPQVRSKLLNSYRLSHSLAFVPTLNFVATEKALEVASLRRSLLRPHKSPHLAALATVVFRV